MYDDDTDRLARALGLLVIRAAALETTLVELIVRLVENTSDEECGQARMKFTGKSGKPLVKELRLLGRDEIADPYEALADQRNHLVHGNGWHLPEVGYQVVQAQQSRKGTAQKPRQKVWQVKEIEALSLQMITLEKQVQAEVRQDDHLPDVYMVTGPIKEPWVPTPATLPKQQP